MNRRVVTLGVKLLVTAGAIAFLLSRQSLGELGAAIRGISPAALGLAVLVQLVAIAVGTLRWRILLRAYGASAVATFPQLFKVYLVGQFYNVYVPGAVGGDVLRGVITRKSFARGGATGAVAVVFVERALGAAGVLALTAGSIGLFAAERFRYLLPLCALGVAMVGLGVVALANGARLARWSPRPVRSLMQALPPLTHTSAFVVACLLSLVTQSLVAVCGHVLAHSLDASLTLADSFLAMPLAAAAGYFPFTFAGIGPRDMAMSGLYMPVGAPAGVATAIAFAFLATTLLASSVGGLIQLVRPIGLESTDR